MERFQWYRCEAGIAIFESPGSLEITLTAVILRLY